MRTSVTVGWKMIDTLKRVDVEGRAPNGRYEQVRLLARLKWIEPHPGPGPSLKVTKAGHGALLAFRDILIEKV